MRAVNLIPAEARRGAGGTAGQSGGIVYLLLGAIAGIFLMSVLYAVYGHQITDRKQQLSAVTAQTVAVQAEQTQLAPYVQFASLSQQRTQALVALANGRFDWSKAMGQIARALPAGVTLNALTGGAANASGGAPAAAPPATGAPAGAAAAGPTVSFTGCAPSHSVVGAALTALRSIPGVVNVTLADSSKESGTAQAARGVSGAAAPPSGGSQPATSCPYVTFQGSVVYGTDAVVRVTPPNTSGAAPVQVTAPPGGAIVPAAASSTATPAAGSTTTSTTPAPAAAPAAGATPAAPAGASPVVATGSASK